MMKHIKPVSKGQDMTTQEILTLLITLITALAPIIIALKEPTTSRAG